MPKCVVRSTRIKRYQCKSITKRRPVIASLQIANTRQKYDCDRFYSAQRKMQPTRSRKKSESNPKPPRTQ